MRVFSFVGFILVASVLALSSSNYFWPSVVVNMDQLPADQQAAIIKTSSDRMRQILVSVGEDEGVVSAMDRLTLMDSIAKQRLQSVSRESEAEGAAAEATGKKTSKEVVEKENVIEGIAVKKDESKGAVPKQKTMELTETVEPGPAERALAIRKLELQFEMDVKKLEIAAEREKQKQELEAERERAERDRLAVERERDKERIEERERRRLEREHEFQLKGFQTGRISESEIGYGEQYGRENTPRWEETLAGRTKRFGDTLRHVLPKMPTDVGQIPQYFENVEHLYDIYDVPADLRSKLLIPHLSDRAKTLIGRLDIKSLDCYDEMKHFLLGEFKLTAMEYKARFDKADKRSDETHILFASRLRNELRYYLSSRGVDDFDKLCNLLVSDKLKSCLTSGTLNYVLSLEGEGCFQPDEIARLADTYINYHIGTAGKPGQFSPSRTGGHRFPPSKSFHGSRGGRMSNPTPIQSVKPNTGNEQGKFVRRCYRCQSTSHLAKNCLRNRQDKPPTRYGNHTQVNACSIVSSGCQTEDQVITDTVCHRVMCDAETFKSVAIPNIHWEFSNYPEINCCNNSKDVDTQCVAKSPPELKVSKLQYVNVTVNGIKAVALCDSGSQIPIVSSRLFDVNDDEKMGTVNLQGIVGEAVSVPLMSVNVKLCGDEQCEKVMDELQLLCAVAELKSPSYDVILPVDVVDELHSMPAVSVTRLAVAKPCEVSLQANTDDTDEAVVVMSESKTDEVCDVDCLGLNDGESGAEDLVAEQHRDVTLAACWEQAKQNKGDFVVCKGVLYHKDKIEEQPICQLCVPESKRLQVMKLAHDSVFGCHLGEKKTRERIRLSFYWPKMRQCILNYVRSCRQCQLRSRPMKADRVPITPITRAELPFQVMNMDCIGPLDPPSTQGHRYCLCVVDNCTRWPAVYALKNLSAKAVCEALIDLFTHVGIPQVLISDCGSNFTSQMTQEMLSRLGCSPRFNTPGHPEASGLVERFNQTCKNMLFHVVQQHGKQWHKFLPLMTWAIREVPNSTTGVSPYMLVYGRVPRGPLAVLKESWTGERDVSMHLNKSVEEYLTDLRNNLDSVADLASMHAEQAQKDYVSRYNLRSRDKHFQEGDLVVVLATDNAGKLCPRWVGPVTIVKVKSRYSYLVDMGNGQVRHVHANKIRKFVARAHGCGVISDSDVDFGRVLQPVNDVCDSKPSQRMSDDRLAHLTDEQRSDLLSVIDEYDVVFSDRPGLYIGAVHRIETTADFQPKRMRAYRVPEVFKPDVEKQIKELLDMGLIRPSVSPMASPIVCVAKKSGGVRLAVDYRYLNSFTIADAYPMTTVNEILNKMGSARFVSLFDAKSGYWQVPVAEKDQWKTAFVTHDGLYEWTRMPFGLRNAGATFVRAMKTILYPIRSFADTYVDDMAIGSADWSQHVCHVKRYLQVIRDAGITLNLDKCDFGKPEVKLVGHIVGSGCRKADPERTKCMKDMPRPRTKRELRKFLGAMGYYRDYIPQFAKLAKPLTDLTSKKTSNVIQWEEAQENSFQSLKARLSDSHVLRIPLLGVPFCLHTDASGTAVGATLGQKDASGVEHPLAFVSQKLTATQCRWSTIEREAYAIVWALGRFRDLILGSHIVIFCDHNPLQYIRESTTKSAKLLRWSLALSEFDLEIYYTKGSQNVVADYLSRL